jgi:hypothetical protein
MADLDHYLEILALKPSALPGSHDTQARAAGAFTSAHEAFWAAARTRQGDGAGTKALIEVLLLLHRRMPAPQATAGITSALASSARCRRPAAYTARDHPGLQGRSRPVEGDGVWGWVIWSRSVVLLDPLLQ